MSASVAGARYMAAGGLQALFQDAHELRPGLLRGLDRGGILMGGRLARQGHEGVAP